MSGFRPAVAQAVPPTFTGNRFASMGPPYPSGVPRGPSVVRNQAPYRPAGPRHTAAPMAYRYRLFSAGPEVSRNFVPAIINIEESSSSSSSPVSSDGEDNDTDTSSTDATKKVNSSQTSTSTAPPAPKVRAPRPEKYDNKGTMGSGNTRTMEPILIESDESDKEEVSISVFILLNVGFDNVWSYNSRLGFLSTMNKMVTYDPKDFLEFFASSFYFSI